MIGPTGSVRRTVLVDCGADDIVFPMSFAAQIGIDLSSAPQLHAQGVGSLPTPVSFAPVILLLTDSIETHRWRAVVGFTTAPLRLSLFGMAGGIQHFRTTIDYARCELEMHPLPSLPVTQDRVP
jgi:hypothetical protein